MNSMIQIIIQQQEEPTINNTANQTKKIEGVLKIKTPVAKNPISYKSC